MPDFNYSTQHNREVANQVISSIKYLPLKDRLELLREIDNTFLEDRKIHSNGNDNPIDEVKL